MRGIYRDRCVTVNCVAILCAMEKLTPKQAKFARHLFEGSTQAEAYKASYDAANMTEASIVAEAKKLAANPAVQAAVAEYTADAEYVAQLNVAWVLKQYMRIATADVNELVEQRQECCRHCYGIDHKYQWVDAEEWALELANVMQRNAAIEKRNLKASEPSPLEELPTLAGGVGFWATKGPVDTCPKCFGNGHLRTHLHDTRKAKSPLYAGVKMTAAGPEIKLRDQDGALQYLAKYLGIDTKTLEISGPGGGPISLKHAKAEDLSDDQLAAIVAAEAAKKDD